MPRPRSTPRYRKHKRSGQAVVTLPDDIGNRHDVYLGRYGTSESRVEYARVIKEWETNGRRLLGSTLVPSQDVSINELVLTYWNHVEAYYVKDGEPTSEQETIRQALRPLRKLYGLTRAREFGPLSLKAVRQAMVEQPVSMKVKNIDPDTGEISWAEKIVRHGLARRHINKQIGRIKRMFGWAVEEEILPVSVYQALTCVKGLRKGKGQGRETGPVKPVADACIEAVLPHVPPTVRDMIEVQRLAGMRPQEVVGMRTLDIDMTDDIWEYKPDRHKMEHHDRDRIIFLGPRAQSILKPLLSSSDSGWIFSPKRSEANRNANRRRKRACPMTPSQAKRALSKNRKRAPGDRYTVASYRKAIRRGCKKAGIAVWSPNQLRHSRATEIRKQFGLEAAQAVLGHAELEVTQVYAEVDMETARRVVSTIG